MDGAPGLPGAAGALEPGAPLLGAVALAAAAAASSARKSACPSVEPSSASLARSGWGINPTTLPASLQIPAMSSSEPLGLST